LGTTVFELLDRVPMRRVDDVRVDVERGLHARVAELLLRDLHRDAEIVQDRRVYVAKLMPSDASESCAFGGRLQDVREQLRVSQWVAVPIWKRQIVWRPSRGPIAVLG
jgi:hypothetical protein